jgi:hypothetical protein
MNRRIHNRRALIYHLKVLDQATGGVIGYLGNLTTKGLLVFGEQAGVLNQPAPMEMLLPVPIDNHDRIAFKAEAVWSAPNSVPGLHSTGLRICHIAREHRRLIVEAIVRFGSRE